MRHMGVPSGARGRQNPVPATPDTIKAGLAHFADHCAICHGNDGSGDTEIGRNLYPKAPDMRQPQTQNLSDGELFYIIENGVRLTGMPAWGTGLEGEKGSWALVRFIRHLPQLTEEERKQMEQLNPKSPGEMNMPNEEDFLKGTDLPAQPPAPSRHGGHKGGRE
jgi:mono/diheme cytochrome c family protein